MSDPSKTKAIYLKGFGIKLNTMHFVQLDYQVTKCGQDPLSSIVCRNLRGNQVLLDTAVRIDMDTDYFIKVRIIRDDSTEDQHWHYHELGEVKKTIKGIQFTLIKNIFVDTLISDILFEVRSVWCGVEPAILPIWPWSIASVTILDWKYCLRWSTVDNLVSDPSGRCCPVNIF